MQIHKTSITTYKSYHNLRLTFNCALFQEYEVRLPETESVKIVVADISAWMDEKVEGECHSEERRVMVERIDDLRRQIYKLAVNKKMREIEQGNNNKSLVLLPFDALIWTQQSHLYGAHASQIQKTTIISNIKSELSMNSIKKCFKSQLADYHAFNIIFQTIDQNCLCWNSAERRPYLKLSQNWKSVDYQEGHCYWAQVKEDPYFEDFRILQQTILNITDSKLQHIEQKQHHFNESKLLKLKELFTTLYQKAYNEFYKQYLSVFKTPFTLKDNQSFCKHLKHFYHLRNDHHNFKLLIHQQSGQYQSQAIFNAESIQKIHSSLMEEKITNSEYPTFVQKIQYGIGKKQSLQSILKLMRKQTKQERVRYHFLKSKIQWKAGNFYRALAHLRQARRQTKDPHLLYIIKFQQARNWEHLGQVDKAQEDYKQSIIYAQQIVPTSYPFLLNNLKILYWKQGKIEQANRIQQKIKELKRVSSIPKLLKIPQVGCIKIAESLIQNCSSAFKNDKQEKSLSKAQFMKLQTERAPFLIPIWTHFKSFFDKIKPQKVSNLVHMPQNSSYLGQVKMAMHIVVLLNNLQNGKNSDSIQTIIEEIIQHLDLIKKSNLKNYHRFLFLLSFYFQYKQPNLAIEYLETIITAKNIAYSKVVRLSLLKRLAQIYKQQNKLQKLLQLYRAQNVIQSGDMQCLFDFIEISAQLQHHSAVITSGNVYLNSIKQYQTQNSVSKAKETGRLLNRSYEVRLLMLASYSKLRCYDGLIKAIEQLETDLNDKSKDIRAFIIELGRVCFQTYEAGQIQLSYTLIQKLIHYDCMIQEQKDPNIKSQQGTSLFQLPNIEIIYRAYQQISVKMNIKASNGNLEWFKAKSKAKDNQITQNSGHKNDAVQPAMTQTILFRDILGLLNNQMKQRQPNFLHIFQQFQTLLTCQKDLPLLFEQIVAEIINIDKSQGIKSLKANIMHILLLSTSLKQERIATQMYLLYWLSSFKMNFTLSEQFNDYWMNKQSRDIRLDKLLFDYFEDRIQATDSHGLQKLSWFSIVKQEIILLKNQYEEIVFSELGSQDQNLQLKILNFSIKYRTNFDSSLDESDTLIKMEQILAQLDCPDHTL